MYLIRRAKLSDTAVLHKLAKMVHFINLPPDKDIIQEKIIHSRNTFLKVAGGKGTLDAEEAEIIERAKRANTGPSGLGSMSGGSDLFMFVLEDTESGQPLGSSQVLAGMGGEGNPNYALRLSQRSYFTDDLHTGTTHTVAELHEDTSSPSEIGGLILQPSFRGHKKKLGLFLSLIRFHMIGLYRDRFADRVLAEMMAPISPDGGSLFWDAFGRRFIPLSYDEADRFCQYSRAFIANLMPDEPIFLSLLPPKARNEVGQVGEDTKPAKRMLERLGFKHKDMIDPFDGGPHLSAVTDEIIPVKETRRVKVGAPVPVSKCKDQCIVSVLDPDGDFRAIDEMVHLEGKTVSLTKAHMQALRIEPGSSVGVTPMKPRAAKATSKKPAATKKSKSKKASKTKARSA